MVGTRIALYIAMVRFILPLFFSLALASTAQANLCKQSLSLVKSSKNNILEVSSQVINQLTKKRILRTTSELDTAFVEQAAQAYYRQLESGKTQEQVAKNVISHMNVTPVADLNDGQVLQLEHILAFEHAKKLSGLTTTSLYDEWKALESLDKRVFIFKTGDKRKIKIKTRRITKGYVPKALQFLFSFQFKVKAFGNTLDVGTATNLKMNARGFTDPKIILPRRSPKDINEMVEYTWQLSRKMYDVRFASQFILPSFYSIGTYPVVSANGAPHTPVNFDTQQDRLSYNASASLNNKNYMGFAFYQSRLFLSQFGKVFTKDYRNKVIGALAYHDALVYEMLTSLRRLQPNFMPLSRKDKWRMGGLRNHVYGILAVLMPNPSPRLNRLGIHKVNLKDYNEVFNIYRISPVPTINSTADYLASEYNQKFGTKFNYKWAANNVGRMWFATFSALTISYTPQIYAAGKTVDIPVVMEFMKASPSALWDLGVDVFKGVDRNAEDKAKSYSGQIWIWNFFYESINSVCSATEDKQQLWNDYWQAAESENHFFKQREMSYVMAYKLLNGQKDFVQTAESAMAQLSRENKDLEKRADRSGIDQDTKLSHLENIKENNQKIEDLNQKIEASSSPEFIASLKEYLHHYQNMESEALASLRVELGSPRSEADFVRALEAYLDNQ